MFEQSVWIRIKLKYSLIITLLYSKHNLSGAYIDLLLWGGGDSNFLFNTGSKCISKIVGNI
jgi:hypothetical protein